LLEQTKRIEEQTKRIEELEEKLKTNSRNSSKPPSTDKGSQPKNKPSKSKKKQGGQPGHAGKGRALFAEEEINQRQACYPEKRCSCGGEVKTTCLKRRHQTVDIPEIKPIVTEYQLYAGTCQGCGKCHEATLPAGVSNQLVGPRLLGLIGALTGGYRLSKRLVQGLLQDLYRINLSVGIISESEEIISTALKAIVEEAHSYLQKAAVVHSDETGHKEKGKRQWMWVGIAGMVSVFMARAHRSAEMAKELLGAAFAGILVSDRYTAYTWVDAARRQLCWAHLLRDFTKISERSGAAGRVGERLLMHAKRMFRYWHQVRDGTLKRERFVKLMSHMRAEIEATLHQGVYCDESKTANTCKAILKLKAALWTFADTDGVDPTNNLAERTIRSYVIWRKTSFGTQSKRGSVYMERVMTTVGSCKLQGRNILEFITHAVRAHIAQTVAPSLLPARVG
jgi:transposase